jgi:PBP1b-binding outer membrane lipoprotein LpoB
MHRTAKIAAAILLAALAGCNSNAIKENRTTFLSADDLVEMTDKMATSLASDAKIAALGKMTIVIKPVINETNEIIRGNRAEMFVGRVQSQLASKPALHDRFVFVLNRDDFEKLRREEYPDLGPSEDRIIPQYALYAKFQADTHVTAGSRSDYYLCTYFLTRIGSTNTNEQVWSGEFEVKKKENKQFLD